MIYKAPTSIKNQRLLQSWTVVLDRSNLQ